MPPSVTFGRNRHGGWHSPFRAGSGTLGRCFGGVGPLTVTCLPMSETWRPCPGYESTHEVSDEGRVRSLDRVIVSSNGARRQWRGKVIRGSVNPVTGYRRVSLAKAGIERVAPLVLQAFVGDRPEGHVVMHLNNDRTDDRLCNLRWGTQSENIRQSVLDKTHANARKVNCPKGHPYDTMNGRGRRCRRCHADNERRRLSRKKMEK